MMIELGENLTKVLIHIVDGAAIVCGVYLFSRGLGIVINGGIID